MRVAAKVQSEMAVVLRGIFGLCLAAQDDFVDQMFVFGVPNAFEDPVEMLRAHIFALGEFDANRCEEIHQRIDFLDRGLVVGPVDQLLLLFFKGLGGSDIGENHELLDQPMRVEARRRDHPVHGAIRVQQDLAFWQVEIERRTLNPFKLEDLVSCPEGAQNRFQEVAGDFVRLPVDCRLGLLVGKLGRRAHHDPVEGVPALAAVLAHHHAHGNGRAVHAGFQ